MKSVDTITSRPNVMVILVEVITYLPIAQKPSLWWTNIHMILWPKNMPQSKEVVLMKVHQSITKTCPPRDPGSIIVANLSTNMRYMDAFPIFYEVWYAFYNILQILHGYWFASLGSPFGNIILSSSSTRQTKKPFVGLQFCMHNSLNCMVGISSSCM